MPAADHAFSVAASASIFVSTAAVRGVRAGCRPETARCAVAPGRQVRSAMPLNASAEGGVSVTAPSRPTAARRSKKPMSDSDTTGFRVPSSFGVTYNALAVIFKNEARVAVLLTAVRAAHSWYRAGVAGEKQTSTETIEQYTPRERRTHNLLALISLVHRKPNPRGAECVRRATRLARVSM